VRLVRVLTTPSAPHLFGWSADTKEHGEQRAGSDGKWGPHGAKHGWLMMIRHGLSVANMQKDTFKGVCDERYVDAPLSPQVSGSSAPIVPACPRSLAAPRL
jgi:hypothetical protein